jgi:hypothetical protein
MVDDELVWALAKQEMLALRSECAVLIAHLETGEWADVQLAQRVHHLATPHVEATENLTVTTTWSRRKPAHRPLERMTVLTQPRRSRLPSTTPATTAPSSHA